MALGLARGTSSTGDPLPGLKGGAQHKGLSSQLVRFSEKTADVLTPWNWFDGAVPRVRPLRPALWPLVAVICHSVRAVA